MGGFYSGAEALLDRLSRSGHRLACLTGADLSRWSSLCKRLSGDRYFSHCFLSCEIGGQKPGSQVYRTAIGSLRCASGEIVYFDDRTVNVQAGARSGMDAHQADGVGALEQQLL